MSSNLAKSAPTERFGDRVENYVKYRPHYPKAIIDFMSRHLGLAATSLIADVGSGTGISSELFLKNGNMVYAVEPNPQMRAAAEDALSKYPLFHSLSGSAEATGLSNQSVDFVVVAQAFHWFQLEKAKLEFKRILKPQGRLVLIWNDRITNGFRFAEDYESFTTLHATDYKQVTHKNIQDHHIREFLGDYQIEHFSNFQEFNFEGLLGRVLSSSYMPNTAHPRFPQMKVALHDLFEKHAQNGFVRIEYDTQLIYRP